MQILSPKLDKMSSDAAAGVECSPVNCDLLDCSDAQKDYWLVQVPSYVSELWSNASTVEDVVGEIDLNIEHASKEVKLVYRVDEGLLREKELKAFAGNISLATPVPQKMAVISCSTESTEIPRRVDGFISHKVCLIAEIDQSKKNGISNSYPPRSLADLMVKRVGTQDTAAIKAISMVDGSKSVTRRLIRTAPDEVQMKFLHLRERFWWSFIIIIML